MHATCQPGHFEGNLHGERSISWRKLLPFLPIICPRIPEVLFVDRMLNNGTA